MGMFLSRMMGAIGRSVSNADGGRTIGRTRGDLGAVLAAVARSECIPYSRPQEGVRKTQQDSGAVSVEEGVAADFDLPACSTN